MFPYRYQRLGTRRNAVIVVIFVWLSSFVFTSYNIASRYEEAGQCKPASMPNREVLEIAILMISYLIPIVLMLFVYSHIALVLKRGTG